MADLSSLKVGDKVVMEAVVTAIHDNLDDRGLLASQVASLRSVTVTTDAGAAMPLGTFDIRLLKKG